MKLPFFTIVLLCMSVSIIAQDEVYERELRNLYDLSLLPSYRNGKLYQLSSYDRTGGNDDGFSGKYSYIRTESNDRIVADIKGAGIINRIWTPTPSIDTIKFYFDGEKEPRIKLPFIDLFSGNVYPFVQPLCGNEIGGYYCYLPIPYEKSLKIVYNGDGLKFHQIQYRELEEKDKVKSFSFKYFNRNKEILQQIANVWNRKTSVLDIYGSQLKSKKINLTIRPGEEKPFWEMDEGGRIVGIEINANNDLLQSTRDLLLVANWDNEQQNAIETPFLDFFGYAFGRPSMNSLLLGATASRCYSYLPMPFDKSAGLSLDYKDFNSGRQKITITGTVYYTGEKRDKKNEGKLYTQSRREYKPKTGEPYLISDINGKGHYIGTVLIAQGLEEGMTLYWESDDCATVDGEMRMHGTGSEDYFNGGWYAVHDRWDTGVSLPLHGSLLYNLKAARTGGYRFFLTDKINFNSSYNLTIEHGPEENRLAVDYTSVGLFYADNPQFDNKHLFKVENPVKRRDILLAQDMTIRLYWFTQAVFGESSMLISSKGENHWTTNIDFEAVPMAQIDLSGLDNGRYKVHVVHKSIEGGKPFMLWQRTNPLSDWINAENGKAGETITIYGGEIKISDQLKTITIRKKKMDDTVVNIERLIFEKITE